MATCMQGERGQAAERRHESVMTCAQLRKLLGRIFASIDKLSDLSVRCHGCEASGGECRIREISSTLGAN